MIDINKTYPLDANTEIAKAFLGIFGCNLEEREDMSGGANLKVYREGKKIGRVYIDTSFVLIEATTPLGQLKGFFEAKENLRMKLVGNSIHVTSHVEQQSNIEYKIFQDDTHHIEGLSTIECTVDMTKGSKCFCHHDIKFMCGETSVLHLKTMLNSQVFQMEKSENGIKEKITVSPYRDFEAYISHNIEASKQEGVFKTFAGIYTSGDKTPNLCHVFKMIKTPTEERVIKNEHIAKEGYSNSFKKRTKFIHQLGSLMNSIDPEMYRTLKELRKSLEFGDLSFLDEILNSSLINYSDDEIDSLFGFIPTIGFSADTKNFVQIPTNYRKSEKKNYLANI